MPELFGRLKQHSVWRITASETCTRLAVFGCVLVAGTALLVLFGWWENIGFLKSVRASFITMKANTALGQLMLALAVLCSLVPRSALAGRWLTWLGKILPALVGAVGLLTLYEYLSGSDLGIDQWIVRDPDTSGLFPPGRLAPVTAVNFVLLALALLTTGNRRRNAYRPAQFLIFSSFLCSFQAFIDYLVGETYVFGRAFYTQMAVTTSVLFTILCACMLLAQRRKGIMRIMTGSTAGGIMARNLIATAVLVPPIVNLLVQTGYRHQLFDADFAMLIRVEGCIVFFMVVVWHNASTLHCLDIGRRRSRAKLEASQVLLRASYEREMVARAAAERLLGEAQSASRLKDEFLATMSHELRTPINVIHGFAELLTADSDTLSPEMREGVEAILRNARTQTHLINDLLDVSGIVTGNLTLHMQAVDLRQVLQQALDSLQLAIKAKNLQLRLDLAADLGPIVGDPLRLQQVLWNIVANAVKFTPPMGSITITARRSGPDVSIVIRDSGEGIAADFLPYVFDRFRQQDGSKTRRHGGLGLGLAIVRHLVEMHGGVVEASSDGVGCGATFTISLPRAAIGAVAHDAATPAISEAAPSAQAKLDTTVLRGLDILVVDDAPDVRLVVRKLLQHYGATVREAASVAEAIAAVAQAKPDVLISDIGMPEEDGYALIRKLRAIEKRDGGHIPAAALSAHTRADERDMSLQAGFEMHINKPVRAAALVENVVSLARYRSARQAPSELA